MTTHVQKEAGFLTPATCPKQAAGPSTSQRTIDVAEPVLGVRGTEPGARTGRKALERLHEEGRREWRFKFVLRRPKAFAVYLMRRTPSKPTGFNFKPIFSC